MVQLEQIQALLDFLECNQVLALGHVHRSKEGRDLSRRLWATCADTLNSIGPDCPRSAEGWRMYYNELKYKTLKKLKKNRAEYNATGETHSARLTPTQERLCTILGQNVGDLQPDVDNTAELKPSQERFYTILGQDVGDPLGVCHSPHFEPKYAEGSSHPASQGTTHQQRFQPRLKSIRRGRKRGLAQTSRAAFKETRAMVLQIEEKQTHTESLLAEAALRNAEAAKLHAEAAVMTAETYKLSTQTMATFTENLSLIMPAVLHYIETQMKSSPEYKNNIHNNNK